MADQNHDELSMLMGDDSLQVKTRDKSLVDVVDETKQHIEENQDSDLRDQIINADFAKIDQIMEEDQKSLAFKMLSLQKMLDSFGNQFEGFENFNEAELAIEKLALARKATAEAKVKDIEGWSDNMIVKLFTGKNSKLLEAKSALEKAITAVELSVAKMQAQYRNRLENAPINETLDRITHMAGQVVTQIKERIVEINGDVEALKVRLTEAERLEAKSATMRKQRKDELDVAVAELEAKERRLSDKGLEKTSPDYIALKQEVTESQQKVEELKGKYNVATEVFNSKEAFTQKLALAIKTLTSQSANLKGRMAKLQSDTQERTKFYQGYFTALMARNDQEIASVLDSLGIKADEKVATTLAAIHTASHRDRIEAQKKHPKHIERLHKVRSAVAEQEQKFKQEDERLLKEFIERYGIPEEQAYSWYYEGKTNGLNDGNDDDGIRMKKSETVVTEVPTDDLDSMM